VRTCRSPVAPLLDEHGLFIAYVMGWHESSRKRPVDELIELVRGQARVRPGVTGNSPIE
jgi:hypothetical protein